MYVSVEVLGPGTVRLSGTVDQWASKTRAEELMKALEGVEVVDNQIRVSPADRHA